MVGYASPSAFRTSVTGVTGMTGYTTTGYADSAHTQSVYSPRESLQDSRQYAQYSPPRPGEEGADVQRWGTRVSRSSRRGVSRRASVYSGWVAEREWEGEAEVRRALCGWVGKRCLEAPGGNTEIDVVLGSKDAVLGCKDAVLGCKDAVLGCKGHCGGVQSTRGALFSRGQVGSLTGLVQAGSFRCRGIK
ncbi:hypothetical protein BD309DRAFT_664081 [Dichomitus squalens]|nr:hypothetical protein BD309DRAFT_664081 [Dichomitus squalens]